MANQDLVIPMLPRVVAPKPLPKEHLTVHELKERPVIAEKWDQKNPIDEDPSYQMPEHKDKKEHKDKEDQQQAHAEGSPEESTSENEHSDIDPDGHLDLYI